MKLKYVGPKPIISHTGIEFDNNKDDKYTYINIVVQLLKAIDHEYYEDRKYTYDIKSDYLSEDQLYIELKKYCPKLDTLINRSNHNVEDEIEHNLQRAEDSHTLNDEEKAVLEKNLNMMREYLMQRSVNKSAYYCAVNALAQILKKDNIDYIVAPMFQKFAHVFHSIEGVLAKEKFPIDTKIEVYAENNELFVKLDIINR